MPARPRPWHSSGPSPTPRASSWYRVCVSSSWCRTDRSICSRVDLLANCRSELISRPLEIRRSGAPPGSDSFWLSTGATPNWMVGHFLLLAIRWLVVPEGAC